MRQFLRQETGQTTLLFAICMSVIVALVGLSVDVGSLCYAENKLHTAAEAAALAGALEIAPCDGVNNCSAMQAASQSALNENGLTGGTLTTNCGTSSNTSLTLMLNNPPCLKGSIDPNNGKSKYVEAVVSMPSPTYFVRLIGFSKIPLAARAEAVRTSNPNCIYALDPTNQNAISVGLLASLSATCGIVDESSASGAFACGLLSGVHANSLKITGGLYNLLCNVNPAPRTNVPVPSPADPLAYLPKPAVLACGSSVGTPYHGSPSLVTIAGTAVLYPDAAYCGGINILSSANVTFMPGTYDIKGLTVSLLSNTAGSGVTFYNYGATGAINFVAPSVTLGHVSLVAPTTGTYAGILFFQDPSNTTPAVIVASSTYNAILTGAFYFPTAPVTCAASGSTTYNILVAKDITFAALTFPMGTVNNTTFNNDYSSLANGSPLAGGGSALVQ